MSLGDCHIRIGRHIERVLILERRRRAGTAEALLEERLKVEPLLKPIAPQVESCCTPVVGSSMMARIDQR